MNIVTMRYYSISGKEEEARVHQHMHVVAQRQVGRRLIWLLNINNARLKLLEGGMTAASSPDRELSSSPDTCVPLQGRPKATKAMARIDYRICS